MSLQDEFKLTYVVNAHDLAVVRHISDLHDLAPVRGADPRPRRGPRAGEHPAGGRPAEPRQSSLRLRFHTRCPYVQPPRCRDEEPPLRELSSGHTVACHWAEEIKAGKIQPREVKPAEAAPEPVARDAG